SIFGYYGVRGGFAINLIDRPNIRLIGSILYAWNIARAIRAESAISLLYGRHALGLLASSDTNLPIIYEAHQLPESKYQYVIENKLFRQKNFYRLVTISEALRRDYVREFSFLDDSRVIVAHDGANVSPREVPRGADLAWPGREGAAQVGYVGHLYPGKG